MQSFKAIIPNVLSATRLLIALVFPLVPESWWIWLIVGGASSDFLDGTLARRWQVQTWQGGLLDAVADKLFVLSVLFTFVLAERFSQWWVPVVLGRDLTVAAIAAYAACFRYWDSFRHMGARWSGKVATVWQFFFFIVVVLFPPAIGMAVSVTAGCSVVAAFDYGLLFRRALRQQKAGARD